MFFEKMIEGYLEAIDFAESPEPGTDYVGLSDSLCKESQTHVRDFIARSRVANINLLQFDANKLGRYLWFTRAGHGLGFWDNAEFPLEPGRKLSEIAHQMGSVDVVLNPLTSRLEFF